jgi:hypothetical protein
VAQRRRAPACPVQKGGSSELPPGLPDARGSVSVRPWLLEDLAVPEFSAFDRLTLDTFAEALRGDAATLGGGPGRTPRASTALHGFAGVLRF